MRAIIDLKDEQVEKLAEICARDHISRSEAVRQAIDALLNTRQKTSRKPAFGIWKNRKLDALDYVDQLRNEWEKHESGV